MASVAPSASGGRRTGGRNSPAERRVFGSGHNARTRRETWRVEEGDAEYPIVLVLEDGEAVEMTPAAAVRLRDALDAALRANPPR